MKIINMKYWVVILVVIFHTSALTGEPSNITDDGESRLKSNNETENDSGGVTLPAATTTKGPTLKPHTSFKDADTWGKDYPKCDRNKNKKMSPVNINTTAAIKVTNVKTMMVYSGDPIRNYTLSTTYKAEGGIKMSVLNIRVDRRIFYEATHIAGFGSPDFRLFRRMIFLFTKGPLSPSRSLHRMNGKVYPMEILMFFYNQRLGGITTQVSVMVEIQEEENPVFYPITEAAKKIMKMKSKTEQIKELKEKLEKENKELKYLMGDPRDPRLQKFRGKVAELTKVEDTLNEDKELLKNFEKTKLELAALEIFTNHTPIMMKWAKLYGIITSVRHYRLTCQLSALKEYEASNGACLGDLLPVNATKYEKYGALETVFGYCFHKPRENNQKKGPCGVIVPAVVHKNRKGKKSKLSKHVDSQDPQNTEGENYHPSSRTKGNRRKQKGGGKAQDKEEGEGENPDLKGRPKGSRRRNGTGKGKGSQAEEGGEAANLKGRSIGSRRNGTRNRNANGDGQLQQESGGGVISEGRSTGRRRNGTRKRKGGGHSGQVNQDEGSMSGRSFGQVSDTVDDTNNQGEESMSGRSFGLIPDTVDDTNNQDEASMSGRSLEGNSDTAEDTLNEDEESMSGRSFAEIPDTVDDDKPIVDISGIGGRRRRRRVKRFFESAKLSSLNNQIAETDGDLLTSFEGNSDTVEDTLSQDEESMSSFAEIPNTDDDDVAIVDISGIRSRRRRRRVKRSFESAKLNSLNNQIAETDADLLTLMNLINREKRKMSPLLKDKGINQVNINNAKRDIEKGKKIMDEYQVGPEHEIKNMSMLKRMLRLEVALDIETEVAAKHVNKTKTKIRQATESTGWSSPIYLFQASWIFPSYGGHFYYDGSSPIPPCNERLHTVVMNKSVGLSKEQFDILASIQTYEGAEPLDEMVPPISDLGQRKVYYNPKNLQYLMDDGVHLRSSDRLKLKDTIKGAGNSFNPDLSRCLVLVFAFVAGLLRINH